MRVFDKDTSDSTGTITGFEVECYDTYNIYGRADTVYSYINTPVSTINDSYVCLTVTLTGAQVQNTDTAAPETCALTGADTSTFDQIILYWTKPVLDETGETLGGLQPT